MRALLLVAVIAGSACGGGAALGLSGADNDPAALRAALAARGPERRGPTRPAIYAALEGGRLAAFDLDAGRMRWTISAVPRSRVVVSGGLIAAREDDGLTARAADDGRKLWSRPIPAGTQLIGLAADGERVYALVSDGRRAWTLLALDAAGRELWRSVSPGALGTPAAARGLVYLPFLEQWLAILDARSGAQLARVRQEDEAVSWVRAGEDGVTYGARGVLRLDEGAASGRRGPGRYVAARLPGFANLPMGRDAFNPASAAYSALDRTRLLWRVTPEMRFVDDTVVLVAQRYLFGLDASTGTARWGRIAQNDVVAAEDTGAAVVVTGLDGEIAAIDRRSGAIVGGGSLGARVLGATIDAEGWRPSSEERPPPPTVTALSEIARDRDARFGAAKLFAVQQLALLPGPDPVRALLAIVEDPHAGVDVSRAAGDALVGRGDLSPAPILIEALAAHADYTSGRAPRGVEVLARALGALGAGEGAAALLAHLEDPATSTGAAQEIARALVAMKSRDSLPALSSMLLLHRCDPRFSAVAEAVADAVAALGGAPERELLAFVAGDARTAPSLAGHVRELLGGK